MRQNLWNTARMVLVCIAMVALFGGCRTFGSVGVGMEAGGPPPPHYEEPPHGKGPPPHAPAHGYREMHRYRYYPEAQVYYDTGSHIYFFIDNGGWQMGATLPHHFANDLDGYVHIEMDTDKPYQHFDENRRQYPPGQVKKKEKVKKKVIHQDKKKKKK